MSFKNEDSFGPADNNDKENIQNNISFEATEQRSEPYQKLNINLFDDAATERTYKQKLIIQTIKNNLGLIYKVIKKRTALIKLKIFLEIKSFSDMRKINKIKAELIYNKLNSCLTTIIKYYKRKESLKMMKNFIRWKDITSFIGRLSKYKIDYEQILQKKTEREIIILENRIKEKEKELNELKKSLNKHVDLETDLLKKIKSYEEKENNFLTTIKNIEEEKKIIYNELISIEKNYPVNSDNQKSLEIKIREFEALISNLQEENKEKDQSINLFLREMGELLQAHEKNIDLLNVEIDSEENKAINNNNLISPNSASKPSIKITNINSNLNPSIMNNLMYNPNNAFNSNLNYNSHNPLSTSIKGLNTSNNTFKSINSKPLFIVTNTQPNSNQANNSVMNTGNNSVNNNNSFSNSRMSLGFKNNISLNNKSSFINKKK